MNEEQVKQILDRLTAIEQKLGIPPPAAGTTPSGAADRAALDRGLIGRNLVGSQRSAPDAAQEVKNRDARAKSEGDFKAIDAMNDANRKFWHGRT